MPYFKHDCAFSDERVICPFFFALLLYFSTAICQHSNQPGCFIPINGQPVFSVYVTLVSKECFCKCILRLLCRFCYWKAERFFLLFSYHWRHRCHNYYFLLLLVSVLELTHSHLLLSPVLMWEHVKYYRSLKIQ